MKLATLCYIRDNGKTLMLHRSKRGDDYHLGKWNGLGGKLQPGESPEEGVRREVLEESGLIPKSLRLAGVITFPLFDGKDDWYVFVYTANGCYGELKESAEGELAWIDDTELTELNLWPGDRIFLPWLDRPEFFSAKFIYQDAVLVEHTAEFY